MNDRRRKLQDDLTHWFILREYQAQCPQMTVDFEQEAIRKYQSDGMFHARVCTAVAGVMELVDKYAEFREPSGE